MEKKKPIPSLVERNLLRLEREYESGLIPEKEYEIRKKEILARASGIPQGHSNTHKVKKQKIKKQKPLKSPSDSSLIKKAFPFLLIGLILLGLSFKIIPELGQKSTVIISTIEKSVPKEIIPSLPQQGDSESTIEPSNIPQISVPAPVSSTSTIDTPTSISAPTNTLIDGYISQDASSHIFTVPEANSIVYKMQSELAINVPRSMSFGSPSIYGGEGIINTSVVRGGYYLFSDRPPKDSNILVTLFVIEPGKEVPFFRELNNYMSSFENAYNLDSTLYEKIDGPKITTTPSVQYQFNFYPSGDKSSKSNVRLVAIKKSNLVVYLYYLDNFGLFSSQLEKEKKIINILNSYK
ncbi:MAG TPA: hypothetical protein PKH80_03775 [Methanofastidiosum sp.]|nr:hypothetical protein [Methanofastidiosum sp.]